MSPISRLPSRTAALACAVAVIVALHGPAWAGPSCTAQSSASITPVVELYTSEGCNSCPPADRWISSLKAEPGVVALAFHVDYWDRLGWKDRFASPAYTQRQAQQQQSNGARFSYTPQVVLNGFDRPQWHSQPAPNAVRERAPAKVDIVLTRDGRQLQAQVRALPGAPARLAAYWAVSENGHSTAVKAGENQGETLKHDFVVRQYAPVAAWNAAAGETMAIRFDADLSDAGATPAEVNLVVIDALTRRPMQAVKLGC